MHLASRGLRDLDGRLERLGPEDTAPVTEQARRVHRHALLLTMVYAAVTLLLP